MCSDKKPILESENVFTQLAYYDEKYFQLKFVNIQNNFENFLVNSWYLNTNILVGPTFISEC